MQTIRKNGTLTVILTVQEAREMGLPDGAVYGKKCAEIFLAILSAAAEICRFPLFGNIICRVFFDGLTYKAVFIPEAKRIRAHTVNAFCMFFKESNALFGLLSALYTMGERERIPLYETDGGYVLFTAKEFYEKRRPVFSEFSAERLCRKANMKKLSDDAVGDIGPALHHFFKKP